MKKRFLSLFLSFAVLLSLCIPTTSMAAGKKNNENGLDAMVDFTLDKERTGRFEYQYETSEGEITGGYVIKEYKNDGTMELRYFKGTEENIIVVSSDKQIFLDGELIRLDTNKGGGEAEMFAHSVRYLDSPPEGTTASDYSKLIRTENKDLIFPKILSGVTMDLFVEVVSLALGFNPVAGIALGAFFEFLVLYYGDNNALSVTVYSYQRPSGPTVAGYGTVTKLVTKWYANRGQNGYIEDSDTVVYRSMKG